MNSIVRCLSRFLWLALSCASYAQNEDYERLLAQRKAMHLIFNNKFRSSEYACKVSNDIEVKFDFKSGRWDVNNNKDGYLPDRTNKLYIIKSDDISKPINLCGEKDEPRSNEFMANKYFCIIMMIRYDGDRAAATLGLTESQTNYKCLLDINNYSGEDILTLNCSENFKFSLNYSKYLSTNWTFGPDSPDRKKLGQEVQTGDCQRVIR